MQYNADLKAAVMALRQENRIAPLPMPVQTDMTALAMMYSPWQTWGEVYDMQTALARATIFPDLDKPFLRGACPRNV